MARPTDQMTAIEKIVCYSQTPRGGRHSTSRATWGNIGAGQEAEREGVGMLWARAFIVISTERNRRGRVSRFQIGKVE